MQIAIATNLSKRKSSDILVLPFWKGKKRAEWAFSSKEFANLLKLPLESGDFLGKEGEIFYLFPSKGKEKRLLLLGLGDKDKFTAEGLRRAYGTLVRYLKKLEIDSMNAELPETKLLTPKLLCKSICEALFLSNYAFVSLKSETKKEASHQIKKVCLIGFEGQFLSECKRVAKICSAVNFTRDLVIGNADDVTPSFLAEKAKELEKEFSTVTVQVFHRKEIVKHRMGLLEAVSRGATTEPAFIMIEYRGNPDSKDWTALVGKGITFDTGGLLIKPRGGMEDMRCDMSGAAAVLGTILASASIGLKKNVRGIIASAENAVGPSSYKPGDVYKSYADITVEIADTDAEGRLVLADALAYLQDKFASNRIIDLATLTGGAVVALGEEVTALFSNDDQLASALTEAGEKTYERVWRLPLVEEYKDLLKSKVADIKNSGGRKASAILGALFINRFIKGKTAWAHLDIAGTAFPTDPKSYHPTSATGVGVRLLVEFLENLRE